MLGNAMDFYLPDVKLSKLREIGMKLQVGGVGYYPTSGSPFVHMDVGGVRAWPRMDRQDLVRLFPDGKTMHIPADGRPLPGYQQAVADYKRRMSSDDIQIASSSSSRRGFFARLFGGGGADEEEDNADTGTAAAPVAVASAVRKGQPAPAASDDGDDGAAPAPAQVQVASVNAPVPQVRPAFGSQPAGSDVASALVSPSRNAAQDALAAAMPDTGDQPQYADLRSYHVPVPSLLDRRSPGDSEVASAEADMKGQLAAVPVPAQRPELAESLLASADADQEAADDQADAGALSPSVIAALEQSRPDRSDANNAVAMTQPSNNVASKDQLPAVDNGLAAGNDAAQAIASVLPQQRPTQQMPMQVAALAPVRSEVKASSRRFNDGFEPTTPQERPIAAGIATKGGRPNKQDAVVADSGRATVTTAPTLTDKMISQWAIAKARVEIVNRPVKAPRFVSPTLRAQPTAVYTDGFKVQTASIDPERFSGSAVNFLQVKKFNSVE
jgi:hypothetical protein